MSAKHVVHWCLTRKLQAIDLNVSANTDPRDFLACAVSKVESTALLKTAIDSHRWFGDFDYGEPQALGKVELRIISDDEGNVYVGEVKPDSDVKHGRGVYLQVAKYTQLHEGWWRDGVPFYRGRSSGGSGHVYDGEYLDGKMHGQGSLRNIDGFMYQGGFKAGKRDGLGVITHANGDREEGPFSDDVAVGVFTCTFADGTVRKREYPSNEWLD